MKVSKGIDGRLDQAWSKLVKLKAGMKCEYCGTTRNLNSHHIFSRSKKSTRWQTINGVCLCVSHHVFSSKFSAHKTSIEFFLWYEEKKGREHIDLLRIKANTVSKLHIFEKEILLTELQKEINSYETN